METQGLKGITYYQWAFMIQWYSGFPISRTLNFSNIPITPTKSLFPLFSRPCNFFPDQCLQLRRDFQTSVRYLGRWIHKDSTLQKRALAEKARTQPHVQQLYGPLSFPAHFVGKGNVIYLTGLLQLQCFFFFQFVSYDVSSFSDSHYRFGETSVPDLL